MSDKIPLSRLWREVSELDPDILEANRFSLCNLYDSETILGLTPILKLQPMDISEDSILSKKPAFKNLNLTGIQYLRSLVSKNIRIPEVTDWAEMIMRFLEINQMVLKKKCKNTFGSILAGKNSMLELTAFLLDYHFAWHDLRYLNIVLKLMDQSWFYSFERKSMIKKYPKKNLSINLLQIRLLIMREAALRKLSTGYERA
jgi:hypothetical protein